MARTVTVFVLSKSGGATPVPGASLEIEDAREDEVRTSVMREIEARGQRLRALSFTPSGLVVYAEEP